MSVAVPDQPVLSTLNRDGSRRWLRPRLSPGRFLTGRRWVAYALILLFAGLPYVTIRGKPAILLDLPRREFTFFGTTFLPTDTLLLAFLLLSIFVGIFLVTALLGRIWCGWGCPQTVYMEYVFRPLERLFEQRNYDTDGRAQVNPLLRGIKYGIYFVVSLVLAHVFLAYFVGAERLFDWIGRSPLEHPSAFLIMAATTGLMMLDFCYFREQVCTLMCPYGRLQSVLLDRQSMIVSYDRRRGEPRGKKRRLPDDAERGDCIDCHLCVATCPTGIDIREGLQMECIGCAQCIDACDEVMRRVDRPVGLIRYSSQQSIEEGRTRLLRPRVVIYPVVLALAVGLFGLSLARRETADVSFLRNRAQPYRLVDGGAVSNVLMLKIVNRSDTPRTYDARVLETDEVQSSELPLAVEPGAVGNATLHVVLPRHRFHDGRTEINVRISDHVDFDRTFTHSVLGPLYGEAP